MPFLWIDHGHHGSLFQLKNPHLIKIHCEAIQAAHTSRLWRCIHEWRRRIIPVSRRWLYRLPPPWSLWVICVTAQVRNVIYTNVSFISEEVLLLLVSPEVFGIDWENRACRMINSLTWLNHSPFVLQYILLTASQSMTYTVRRLGRVWFTKKTVGKWRHLLLSFHSQQLLFPLPTWSIPCSLFHRIIDISVAFLWFY